MKEILRTWLSEDSPVEEGKDALAAEVARLRKEVETYKYAFETTAADRDRWAKKAANLAQTHWKSEYEKRHLALEWVLDNETLLREPGLPLMPGPYPHLVCVGAQKCATSFLYSAVREHPAVTVSRKDTGTVSAEHPVAFEAGLIDRPDGPQRVYSANPNARILICIREPVERAISEYKMRVRAGRETRTFQEAITASEPKGLFAYVRRSCYAEDIERFQSTFKHVLVLSSNANVKANIWRLFGFIGLRDPAALVLAANPPMQYAASSSADAQAKRAKLTPEQRKLHDVVVTVEERSKLYEAYFDADQRRIEAVS